MEFKRLFTRQEAESTLPLVRQIVADILETGRRIQTAEENDDEVRDLETALEENLGELAAMGCYFKDWNFSVGLVDFPAVINGETVFCAGAVMRMSSAGITASRKATRGGSRCREGELPGMAPPHPFKDYAAFCSSLSSAA